MSYYIWQAFSNFGGVSVGGCVYIVADYASKKIFEGCPASEKVVTLCFIIKGS